MANTMLKSLPLWVLAAMPAVYAQGNTDNGNIAACKSQSCTDCPIFASVNEQFPDCITYPSAGNLDGYDTENGNVRSTAQTSSLLKLTRARAIEFGGTAVSQNQAARSSSALQHQPHSQHVVTT